ncbi:hypothetical protein MRX96_024519 [Rhipicephalus microplus]
MGRRVGVGRTNCQVCEVRESSIRLRDRPKNTRVCELSPSTHPQVQSHGGIAGCPRPQKTSLLAHHRRHATTKLPAEIQFIEANDSHIDQQPLSWTLLFKWVERELPRHHGSLRALQQHAEANITMLPTFELSIYRAEDPPAAGLTKSIVQAFSRINFHHSAPCVLFGAKMQKGRKWLPLTISDIRSALTTRECFTVRGEETAQVWIRRRFSNCCTSVPGELSTLPTSLPGRGFPPTYPLAPTCLCQFPQSLTLASHASLSRSILKGMEITKPILVKSIVFGSSEASRGWWQNETGLLLGCCHSGQSFVKVLSRTLAMSA